jgi:hypothetical protein
VLRRRAFGLSQIKVLNVMTPIFRAVDKMLLLPPLSLIAVIKKPHSVETNSHLVGTPSTIPQGSATGFNE